MPDLNRPNLARPDPRDPEPGPAMAAPPTRTARSSGPSTGSDGGQGVGTGVGGPPPGQPVTLRDVAAESGVSTATASRVLSAWRAGRTPSSASAERVISAAEKLGYQRNTAALALRTRQSLMIGVLVPDLTDIAISSMYKGIEREAALLGYQTCVANTEDLPATRAARAEALSRHGVDGLIYADAHLDDPYFGSLDAQHPPYVLVNRPLSAHDSVSADDEEGGRMAAEHLCDLGHRHLAVLAGPAHAPNMAGRSNGFAEAARRRGVRVQVVHGSPDADSARNAAVTLLADPTDRPTGFFAVADVLALGVLTALRDQGLQVPGDAALVGFNDSVMARHLAVPLTSIRHPLEEMGAHGLRLLLQRMSDPDGDRTQLRLPPELVVRESSGPQLDRTTVQPTA